MRISHSRFILAATVLYGMVGAAKAFLPSSKRKIRKLQSTTATTTASSTFQHTTTTRTTATKRRTSLCSLAQPANIPFDEIQSSSSSSSSSSSFSSHELEVSTTGRILEGGHIIDYAAVKGPSRAEKALLEARGVWLEQQNTASHHSSSSSQSSPGVSNGILGINQEVIDEVGHPLATFATAEEVQRCAAYLRSQAPPGLLESNDASGSKTGSLSSLSFSDAEIARFQTILQQAFHEAGEVTDAFAKTFYMGTQLLPEEDRKAIWAVYVWCRRTDEIVDAPRDNPSDMLLDLSAWEMRLEDLFQYGQVDDIFDLCLLQVRIKYPTMPITPFMDMIRGMLMDVPGLGQDRYDRFEELHLYCYRVAGTVGLMSLPIFGCAPGFTDDQAREPALSLGVAFQLTNILRDVGEDAVKRGRVYLPKEDMERFGVTEAQIFEQRVDQNYINLMRFEISRARMYYERARRGVFMLAEHSRLPVQSSLDAYGGILTKIEENGYDSLTKRAYLTKWEKLAIIPFSWYRTLDISNVFPLPGDKPVQLEAA